MLTEMEDWADLSDEDGTAGVGGNDSDSSISKSVCLHSYIMTYLIFSCGVCG